MIYDASCPALCTCQPIVHSFPAQTFSLSQASRANFGAKLRYGASITQLTLTFVASLCSVSSLLLGFVWLSVFFIIRHLLPPAFYLSSSFFSPFPSLLAADLHCARKMEFGLTTIGEYLAVQNQAPTIN